MSSGQTALLWLSVLIGWSSTAQAADTQAPTAPTGLAATVVSSGTQVNLSWTASTDNVGVQYYGVERCRYASCTNFAQITTPYTTSLSDTGLIANTVYRYRIRARDAATHWSGYSSILTVSTDVQAPTIPTNLTATVSGTQVTLRWAASTDNVGVLYYIVYRCKGSACSNFQQISTPYTNSLTDTGLSSGSVYRYKVSARDAANNTSATSVIKDVTVSSDTQAPSIPTNLTGTPTSTQITLSWAASTDNSGGTITYLVESCSGAGCTNFMSTGTSTTTSYSHTGLSGSTVYRYKVKARDAANNLSDYSTIYTATTTSGDTQDPSIPMNLTATASSTQVNLSWTASTDNVGVKLYVVYRCKGSACTNFQQISTPYTNSLTDPGLSSGSVYRYKVYASDAAGNNSDFSQIKDVTTQAAGDTTPPSIPGALTATPISSTQVNLSWTASTDTQSAIAAYLIDRCLGSGCSNFALLATVTTTAYSDTTVSGTQSYSYRVRARDAANNVSDPSSLATTMSPDCD